MENKTSTDMTKATGLLHKNSSYTKSTFPIREGVLAELTLPKGLTLKEVNRLNAYLFTLASEE